MKMKENILQKITAVLLIVTLTMANFLLLGVNMVTYAAELATMDRNTSHKNVEFMAYFKDAQENELTEASVPMNAENLKLQLEVVVKQEGYFNGKITLDNANFKLKSEILSEGISKVEGNTIELTQINAGETRKIEVGIELIKDEKFDLSLLDMESKISIEGTYKDSTEKDIKVTGTRTVQLLLVEPYSSSAVESDAQNTQETQKTQGTEENKKNQDNQEVQIEQQEQQNENVEESNNASKLEQSVLTNKVTTYDGKTTRMLQLKVESVLEGNEFPVQSKKIEMVAPKINNKYPEKVLVTSMENLVTNGKELSQDDWKYDAETGKVEIQIKNEAEENKVTWKRTGTDKFIVTYFFDETASLEKQKVQTKSETTLYDKENTVIVANSELELTEAEVDGMISVNVTSQEENIYKGKLYAGIEREFVEQIDLDVSVSKVADSVELVENGSKLGLDTIYTKQTQFKKENMQEILGEEGSISILNANTDAKLAYIDVNTQADENGNIVVSYPENIKEIKIKITKPMKEGKLVFYQTKVIKQTTSKKLQQTQEMEYGVDASYRMQTQVNPVGGSTAKINLLETQTSAHLEINKTELSTMTTNKNVEIRAVLETRDEKNELYKNPKIVIQLPEKVEKIEVKSLDLLYEDELKIKSAGLKGNTIEIQLEGEQTKYKEQAIEGATIIINAELTTNRKIGNSTEQIKMTYTNQKAMHYAEGKNQGEDSKDINLVSYAGVVTTNEVPEYNLEVVNNEGDTTAKLDLGAEAKQATIQSEIINNNEGNISNVKVLGTYPTKDATESNNIDVAVGKVQVEGIDESKVKVYYSENADANINLEDSANQWKEELTDNTQAKKYLVTIANMGVQEGATLSYDIDIPEKLEYNQEAKQDYEVYYTNDTIGVNQKLRVASLSLETGEGPVVETSLKALLGVNESSEVKEGQIIKYQLTATNTGSENATDIKMVGQVPEGTVYVEELPQVAEEIIDEDEEGAIYKEYQNIKQKEFTIEKLAPGETVKKEYEVRVKAGTKNTKIKCQGTINYGEVEKKSNQVEMDVKEGQVQLSLTSIDDTGVLQAGYAYRYLLRVKNLTGKDLSNVELDVSTSELTVNNLYYNKVEGSEVTQIDGENNSLVIDKISADEEISVSISVSANMFVGTETKLASISVNAIANGNSTESNQKQMQVKSASIKMQCISENAGDYVKAGDIIKYKIKVINEGQNPVNNITISNKIEEYVSLVSVKLGATELSNEQYRIENDIEQVGEYVKIETELQQGESKEYEIDVVANMVPGSTEAIQINNETALYSNNIEFEKAAVQHILEPEEQEQPENTENPENPEQSEKPEQPENTENPEQSEKPEQPENIENPEQSEKPEQPENIENPEKPEEPEQPSNPQTPNNSDTTDNLSSKKITKVISGIAWLDKDENGQKDNGEDLLQGITVRLLDTKTNKMAKDLKGHEITTVTNESGFYSLAKVPQGEYMVIFEYDTSKYILATYKKEGVSNQNSSKVVDRKVTIEGQEKTVAATEVITIENKNIGNMNIGLKDAKTFDLKLDKYISKVIVQNSKGTSTQEYDNATFAKAEIDAKLINNTNVIVEYKIKVTNEGEVDAYIKNIADYVSSDYKFSSELNKDWYQSNGKLYNKSLANEKIKPGESKEIILTLTKKMTENNTGLINNTAEIVESYNEQGLLDVDSVAGNNVKGEDDLGSADLILSIKTGQIVTTVTLILTTIILVGVGAYFVAKIVLRKRII